MGEDAPALQDARLLPGLRQHQQLPDPELLGQPRGAQGPPAFRSFPVLRAGCAAATAAAPGWGRDAAALAPFAFRFDFARLERFQRGDARVAGEVDAAAVGDDRRVGAVGVAEDAPAAAHHEAGVVLLVNSAA